MAANFHLYDKRFHVKQLKGPLAVGLLFLLSLLPLSMARSLGSFIGRRMNKGTGKPARNTRKNIAACFPELDSAGQEALISASLEETGCSMGEMGMSWIWQPERVLGKVTAVQGKEVLDDALAENRGVILIAPHIGNWEVLNLWLSKYYKLTAMYKPPKIKMMDDLIRKKRERIGSQLAPANVKGVRMAVKCLRKNEILGILPDQEPDKSGGIFAPFMGVQAFTMKLLPQLAAQTGAVVVSGYAKRVDGGFELFFHRAEGDINSKDLDEATAAMNQEVEYCVRQVPEQYQWEYRRFSRRPEGEAAFYK